MTIISVIMVSGIVLGLFLGLLLLSLNNRNKKANRFLGFIMIVSSLIVSGFAYTKYGFYEEAPHLLAVASTMIFLMGPLFYLYVNTLTRKDFVYSVKSSVHFLPFMLLVIYLLPFYLQNSENKLTVYFSESFSTEHKYIISVQVIHALVYMLIVKKLIKRHVEEIKKTLSSIDKINLGWIKTGINIFAFIIGSIALLLVLMFFGIKLHPFYSAFIPVAVSITILTLGFVGLRQPIIFPPEKVVNGAKKYEKSTLTAGQSEVYLEKLHELMKIEKPYLNSGLTLQKLAENLSMPHHHLSQLINDKLNKNFFDFINSYRIAESKELLTGPRGKQLTILAIAQESGFNSKSSFNSVFKKYTGKTPSQFKEETLPPK